MCIVLYRMRKILLVYFTILFIVFFLIFINAFAQQLDDQVDKQLKIFQLSNLLDLQNNFPQPNAYFENALQYFYNEHYGFAIKELEKIEYSHLYLPLYLKSQFLKGKSYELLGRWESASCIYQNLMDEIPIMNDYSLFLLGKAYLNMNDSGNAMNAFLRLKNEFPESTLVPQALYQIALLYLSGNQIEQFLKESQSAIQASLEETFKAQVLIRISDVLWERGMFIESLIYLKELIENRYYRENISRYENLYVKRFQIVKQNMKAEIMPELSLFCAEIIFGYRQYQMAETLYEEVVKFYPNRIDLAQTHYNIARAIHYQGEYERAIEQCLYIIKTFDNPDIIARTLYLYASTLMSLEERGKAIEKYREVISKYPESYFARSSFLRIAEIEFLADNEEKGINILNLLITEYPQSDQTREACWKLALYYSNKNEIQKAMQFYQFIYNRFPQSSQGDDAIYWLGKLHFSQNRVEGINWYSILLDKFPDSYYTFRIPIEVKESTDSYNIENIVNFSKRTFISDFRNDNFPKNRSVQLFTYKAELLTDIGFYEESILEIKSAFQIEPENIYLMYFLSEIYSQNNQHYLSITWAQVLLNHFLANQIIEKIPFRIWELAFPVYYSTLIKDSAYQLDLDPYLIWSTIREESHFNATSESKAGARGLMQVILSTGDWIAQKLGYKEFNEDSLFLPEVNIRFGCWYLHYLGEKFNMNNYLIISGYNAGPGITDQWMQDIDMSDIDYFIENIPYPETSEHIKKVMRSWLLYKLIYKN